MTITMSLELEKGAKLDDVAKVLSHIGECFSHEGEELWGEFNKSGSHFVFRYADEFDDVVAEGVQLTWKVGIRGQFIVGQALSIIVNLILKGF